MESSWVTGDSKSFIPVAVIFHKGVDYLVSEIHRLTQLFLLLQGNMALAKAFY